MSEVKSEESPSQPFWLLLGILIFFVTVFVIAIFFEDTLSLLNIPTDFLQLKRTLFGSILTGTNS